MAKSIPKKDEVIVVLLKKTRQLAKHLLKEVIGVPCSERRVLGSRGS